MSVYPVSLNDCYLQPKDHTSIASLVGNGNVNSSFLSSPESELETSFSDEQKLSSSKPYIPPKSKMMMTSEQPSRGAASTSDLELNLPPPPGHMWMPATQPALRQTAHSADGVIGYPYNSPNYVYSMMPRAVHPSMQSLPQTGGITVEEQQLILKYRQEKLMRSQSINSPGTPDSDNGNFYEEVPAYLYRTPDQVRLKNYADGKPLPHLPPISSLPSGSQASMSSGLDVLDEDSNGEHQSSGIKKLNPLYEANDVVTGYSDAKEDQKEMKKSKSSLYLQLQSGHSVHRCYCVMLLIVSILASASLVITLLTSTGVLKMNISADSNKGGATAGAVEGSYNSSDSELNVLLNFLLQNVKELTMKSQAQIRAIDELDTTISSMKARNTQLEILLNQTSSDLQMNVLQTKEQFSSLNNTLISVDNQLVMASEDLKNVNMTLAQAVIEVSKAPGPQGDTGPQGPAGLLNTSLCAFGSRKQQFGSSTPSGQSGAVGDDSQSKIIGASCTGDQFTFTVLRNDLIPGGNSYWCECKMGLSLSPGGRRFCTIHYWRCTTSST